MFSVIVDADNPHSKAPVWICEILWRRSKVFAWLKREWISEALTGPNKAMFRVGSRLNLKPRLKPELQTMLCEQPLYCIQSHQQS